MAIRGRPPSGNRRCYPPQPNRLMAAIYSNENFPKRVGEELRRLGHDVLTSYEAGQANQKIPDDQVLAYATPSAIT
jgi:hypothetical protein